MMGSSRKQRENQSSSQKRPLTKGLLPVAKHWRTLVVASGIIGFCFITSAHVNAARFTPLNLYRLPPSIAGSPHHYFGEGGGCDPQPCTTESYNPGVGITAPAIYHYEVTPNVPSRGTPNNGGVQGYYDVVLYATATDARKANLKSEGQSNLDGTRAAPLLPIASPVAPTEWLRGHVVAGGIPNQCAARAGARYGNAVVDAVLINYAAVRTGQPYLCYAEYHWATRVIKALYEKATAVSSNH